MRLHCKFSTAIFMFAFFPSALFAKTSVKPTKPATDTHATAVIDAMFHALAGENKWRNIAFLRFDFRLAKQGKSAAWTQHLWERGTGRTRIEWRTENRETVVVLFNVHTSSSGRVLVNNTDISEPDKQAYLKEAYRRHVNDTYWLLAPLKLKDTGVIARFEGKKSIGEQDYDIIHVTFNKVGLTPGDHYWFYINQSNYYVDQWAFFLQGFPGTPSLAKAWPWRWSKWKNIGDGIVLSQERQRLDLDWKVEFPVLEALQELDDRVFTDPNMPLPLNDPESD